MDMQIVLARRIVIRIDRAAERVPAAFRFIEICCHEKRPGSDSQR